MRWVSEITTVALEMSIPPMLGNYVDSRFGTLPLLTLLGAVTGFVLGISHLTRLLNKKEDE